MAKGIKTEHKIIDGIECKFCIKCTEWLPLHSFAKDISRWDSLRDRCKKCRSISRNSAQEKEHRSKSENKTKKSEYDNKYKPIKNKRAKDRYIPQKTRREKRFKIVDDIEYKQCVVCTEWLQFSNYHKCLSNGKRGRYLQDICIDCSKKSSKTEEYILHRKKRESKRRKILSVRLHQAVSALMRYYLKNKQGESWTNFVLYSIQELWDHLISKFEPGMTIENYGRNGWQIDHVIPGKYKNSDGSYYWDQEELADKNSETFKKYWSLDNLQPMWQHENGSKGNRYIGKYKEFSHETLSNPDCTQVNQQQLSSFHKDHESNDCQRMSREKSSKTHKEYMKIVNEANKRLNIIKKEKEIISKLNTTPVIQNPKITICQTINLSENQPPNGYQFIIPLDFKYHDKDDQGNDQYYWDQKELLDPNSETYKEAYSPNNLATDGTIELPKKGKYKPDFCRVYPELLEYRKLSYEYSQKDCLREFETIKGIPGDYTANCSRNKVTCTFHQHFFQVENELWKSIEIRRKLINNRIIYRNKRGHLLNDKELLRGFKISGIHIGFSHHSQFWIKKFIEDYGVNSIYDPTAGWGHRLQGAYNINYIGNDICEETVNCNNKMIEFLGLQKTHKMYCNDAATFTPTEEYDSVFTCPPYHTTEIYFGDETSTKTHPSYKEWLEWWRKLIKASIKPGVKRFAYIINHIYEADMNKICEECDLKLIAQHFVGKKTTLSHFQRVSKNVIKYERLNVFDVI